ncbi:hypothetical protein M422DRAFT_257496 [Sphaerobolus stellatus SS14]|uniref:Uncharacterized protein n=1 Tax=Sphaerobolus stellatus (strain SS14) TaxID=990650 RepID=A0A0C9VE32_SPHS4|nr:hypothetical protein M422DRAFT_257496 [Sphaerobolus stellatus SS14]
MTQVLSSYQSVFWVPVYSNLPVSEDILQDIIRKVNSPNLLLYSNREQMISLLDIFHMIVRMRDNLVGGYWENVLLGGIVLQFVLPDYDNYRLDADQPRNDVHKIPGGVVAHFKGRTVFSQWCLNNKESVDKIYQADRTEKGTRIIYDTSANLWDYSLTRSILQFA